MVHAVDKLVLPSIRLSATLAEENEITIGASKLGGLPDLPDAFEWPELNGAPMSFVAQIRLDELNQLDGASILPTSGMLWFFYDAAQESYGSDPGDRAGRQVIFVNDLSEGQLQRRPAPDGLAPEAQFKACSVAFNAEPTLPVNPGTDLPSLMWSLEEQVRYEAVYAAFPSHKASPDAKHRLLGHPDTIQDDMRGQCQLVANGVTSSDDPEAAALLADANDWLLLLQVDSDDLSGMRWANTGMIYFWIKRNDLALRHFDNVWVVLQSE